MWKNDYLNDGLERGADAPAFAFACWLLLAHFLWFLHPIIS